VKSTTHSPRYLPLLRTTDEAISYRFPPPHAATLREGCPIFSATTSLVLCQSGLHISRSSCTPGHSMPLLGSQCALESCGRVFMSKSFLPFQPRPLQPRLLVSNSLPHHPSAVLMVGRLLLPGQELNAATSPQGAGRKRRVAERVPMLGYLPYVLYIQVHTLEAGPSNSLASRF
jgi:hypothetical protein